MKKSILFKYFTIITAIILFSIASFAVILNIFSSNLWKNEQRKLLSSNVKSIAETYSSFSEQIQSVVNIVSTTVGADIYIITNEGRITYCSDPDYNCIHRTRSIPKHLIENALKSDTSFLGTVGIYDSEYYTVTTPLIYNGETIGAVFASASATDLAQYSSRIVGIMIYSAIIIFIFAFTATYFFTAKITKPLRIMSEAAKKMESGDFSTSIPVQSQDEIGQLAAAFERMSKSLASSENMRRSFVSSISHELKTPMTTISGFIDGILDGTIEEEKQQHYLNIVLSETKRLSRLVNSMLQLSKLEMQDYPLKTVDFNLTDVVARSILNLEAKINEKNLNISGLEECGDIHLVADKDLIHQVVYNIIENAVKFTPQNSEIKICIENTDNGAKFSVKNSGKGLSDRELSKIFENFYKTDKSRSEDKTGIGLGLYIVKTIVSLHNGTVKAESTLNEYTEFTISIPNQ